MGCAFFVLFVGLLALVGGVGVLVWLGGRKIVAHVRREPQALPALVEHLIRPVLAGKCAEREANDVPRPEGDEVPKPEPKKIKGFLV